MNDHENGTGTWRLILNRASAGAVNMARDVAILEEVAGGRCPPTLRLYGWSPPCLSLGRHQGLDAADAEFCRAHGIDIVRRPTGGRALLHHHELTYAVMAPLGQRPIPSRLQEAYRKICSALVSWCRDMGVAAELTPGEVNINLPSPASAIPCFEAPAGGEVVVAGRKLIGSAMRAHGGFMLQHGAILLDWDSELQTGSMGLEDDTGLRQLITTMADELGKPADLDELEQGLVRAFSEELGVSFQENAVTEQEQHRERELVATFHAVE
jgi:lipoate-protein ligase A